jgi:hypothetical protein
MSAEDPQVGRNHFVYRGVPLNGFILGPPCGPPRRHRDPHPPRRARRRHRLRHPARPGQPHLCHRKDQGRPRSCPAGRPRRTENLGPQTRYQPTKSLMRPERLELPTPDPWISEGSPCSAAQRSYQTAVAEYFPIAGRRRLPVARASPLEGPLL